MAKRSLPSSALLNNFTWPIIVALILIIIYLYYQLSLGNSSNASIGAASSTTSTVLYPPNHSNHPSVIQAVSSVPIQDVRGDVGRCAIGGGTVGDPLNNAYVPPIKCDAGGLISAPLATTSGRVPINVPTQHYNTQYNQVGILTKQFGSNHDILPLMGRRTVTSRDKWQYYTVAGGGAGGNLQTKLPVKAKNRNCSSEYGCDEIYSGDEVYVEGYQELFRATIYENGMFSYIPI